ncbi:hypothetical protein AUC43_13945 [Hymenobacter sedentarius]|uniref:Uncharacterized protein n=1 Tax=Hymenobacter sedentarius TaxID=1411621 RepID=A0A0U4C0P9_9BACT|nr:hypothetical protein [Hymenobacter sedentarius]ALW86097.1 hypothetical protein AUC43_13945 [Hymenobacter sedentarius]
MQPETATPSSAPQQTNTSKFLISALNGTALYVLAYYLVWGLHQAAKMEVSHFYELRGRWNPSVITYSLADNEWFSTAVIAVYSVGPAVCFLLGIGAFWWFWRQKRAHRGQLKLLLLWVAFHSCNAVFGALLADTFTHSGFWYVPDWVLRMGNVANVLLALIAGLVQLALGYFAAVAFLQAHDSRTVMRYENRRLMVVFTLFIPWLAGGIFIALTKVPYFSLHEGLHLLMMGLLILPLALSCQNEVFSETVRRPKPTYVAWGLVGLAVMVAIAWRLALSPPVLFG